MYQFDLCADVVAGEKKHRFDARFAEIQPNRFEFARPEANHLRFSGYSGYYPDSQYQSPGNRT